MGLGASSKKTFRGTGRPLVAVLAVLVLLHLVELEASRLGCLGSTLSNFPAPNHAIRVCAVSCGEGTHKALLKVLVYLFPYLGTVCDCIVLDSCCMVFSSLPEKALYFHSFSITFSHPLHQPAQAGINSPSLRLDSVQQASACPLYS